MIKNYNKKMTEAFNFDSNLLKQTKDSYGDHSDGFSVSNYVEYDGKVIFEFSHSVDKHSDYPEHVNISFENLKGEFTVHGGSAGDRAKGTAFETPTTYSVEECLKKCVRKRG
jgi:hypothetical protein